VVIVSVILIILMVTAMFYMQKTLMGKNMSEAAQTGQFAQTQKIMLYAFPAIFAIGGFNFPIGVLIYWTAPNFWTVSQQLFVLRRSPVPVFTAVRELHERRQGEGLPPGRNADDEARVQAEPQRDKAKGQRQRPLRAARTERCMYNSPTQWDAAL